MKSYFALLFLILLLFFGGFRLADRGEGDGPASGTATSPPPAAPEHPITSSQSTSLADQFFYLPLITTPPKPHPWIDTQDRAGVHAFYLSEYLASEGIASGWTGSIAGCNPGTTSAAFRDAILRRINYFRSMAGVPPIIAFDDVYNSKAQAAALMMSANKELSHSPDSSWLCYSAGGDEGAGSSNLHLGRTGPAAISGYMEDSGAGNTAAGHRRWILYPQSRYMGTGDIPASGSYPRANALWVFDLDHMWGPRPETREDFVAWPPPGYVPIQLVFGRWSFAYAGADFDAVSVTMTRNGQPVTVAVHPAAYGYGENTVVWEPATSFNPPPGGEISFGLTISGVEIDGLISSFAYTVILFDPNI